MNKKILLGIGSLAAAALPVTVVVACNDDNKTAEEKTAVVTTGSPDNVAATVEGTGNAYTLAVTNDDTINKTDLETALLAMVEKEDGDTNTPTFTGTWNTDFDGTKNATYTYTVTTDGYTDVTFAVTVTGNAAVNGAITLNTGATLKGTAVGSATPYAVTVPNGTAVSTDDVKGLFGGQGTLTVADTDTYKATTAGAYTFTITDPGLNGGTAATATLEVTVQAAKTAVVTAGSPDNVAATVAGTENAYTLAVTNDDTITKGDLETALKAMVAKEVGDTNTPTFTGTWNTDFDGTKNATYTYTVTATGYTDVTFAVAVTGN